MGRVTYNQVNSVGDVLDQVAFEWLLGAIPGALSNTGDLTLRCQNVQLPGFSNEAFEVALHGFTIKYRGRKNYERSLTATYIEKGDFSIYRNLKRWDEYIAGSNTGNSRGYKAEYSILTALRVYDTVGAMVNEHRIEGTFIQDLQSVTLDGTSSAAVNISVTFSYDRFLVSGVDEL